VSRQAEIHRRMRIPSTPSEIAALFGINVRLARAYFYQLRRQGKALRMDRRVAKDTVRGRKWEFLWVAV
jgi:hypothetical protein